MRLGFYTIIACCLWTASADVCTDLCRVHPVCLEKGSFTKNGICQALYWVGRPGPAGDIFMHRVAGDETGKTPVSRDDAAQILQRLRSPRTQSPVVNNAPLVALTTGTPGPSTEQDSCSICRECMQEGQVTFQAPNCIHCFHQGCIQPWRNMGRDDCPNCRQPLVIF
jgi:hypothetical protein